MVAEVRAVVPVLILAAGRGRRMERVKALAPWQGETLLDAAMRQARSVSDSTTVAVGAGDPLVRFRVCHRPRYWCPVSGWRRGQSESLRAGLRFVGIRHQWPGALVMLVDQPLIPDAHLQALAREALCRPHEVVATQAAGRAMAPAYLPRWIWPGVARLSGDQGAGAVLNAMKPRVVPCAAAQLDVDTPQQLAEARARIAMVDA